MWELLTRFLEGNLKVRTLFLYALLGLACLSSLGNNQSKLESLLLLLDGQKDSSRIPTLLSISWELRNSNPEKSIQFGLEAIELATLYKDYENLAKAHGFVGVSFRVMGNYLQSIDYYYTGLEISIKYGITEQEGFAYLNLANLHIYQEYYNSAIDNINRAESIANRIGNKQMLAYAFLYFGRAMQLKNELDSALIYFQKALDLRSDLGRIPEQAVCYKYIADIYLQKREYRSALENYNKSLATIDKLTDMNLHANILVKKSMVYFDLNDLNLASDLAKQSLEIANKIGASLVIRDASQVLATISKKNNNYKLASEYLESVINNNETLFGQQLSEKIFFLEYQIERQQKENQIDILNKDNTIKELELKRARTISIALLIILSLIGILLIATLITLRERRKRTKLLEKQNHEIIQQRESIAQKNAHLQDAYSVIEGYIGKITDNIRYAKRIQEAILPNLETLQPYFSDNFCYYRPKDFVSGDFYWLTIKDDTLFVSVADCTGHGVPGALMSIIGMDLLSQAVNQQNLTEPSEILNFLNIELRNKLRKGEESEQELILKDSLDLAVFSLTRGEKQIKYAGALIPLSIIRNGEVLHYKPDFVSIGISQKIFNRQFKQQTIPIEPDDWIYLYTDGFMDQFGGENNKKLMRKEFLSKLILINNTKGNYQLSELNRTFSSWKGTNEQIDDVLVLGLKV